MKSLPLLGLANRILELISDRLDLEVNSRNGCNYTCVTMYRRFEHEKDSPLFKRGSEWVTSERVRIID